MGMPCHQRNSVSGNIVMGHVTQTLLIHAILPNQVKKMIVIIDIMIRNLPL